MTKLDMLALVMVKFDITNMKAIMEGTMSTEDDEFRDQLEADFDEEFIIHAAETGMDREGGYCPAAAREQYVEMLMTANGLEY